MRYRSKRKQREWRIYVKLVAAFLFENPWCQIKSPLCTGRADCVHHAKGRGALLCIVQYWFASCHLCNGYLETYEGKVWGKEKGFRLDRLAHE